MPALDGSPTLLSRKSSCTFSALVTYVLNHYTDASDSENVSSQPLITEDSDSYLGSCMT